MEPSHLPLSLHTGSKGGSDLSGRHPVLLSGKQAGGVHRVPPAELEHLNKTKKNPGKPGRSQNLTPN